MVVLDAAVVPAAAHNALTACSHRSTIVVAMMQAAALGFAAGVVIELGAPGSIGPAGVIVLALAAAAFFWAFLFPGTRWVRDARVPCRNGGRGLPRGRRWERFMLQVVLFAAAVIRFGWSGWRRRPAARICMSLLPPLSGASAWPSQFLRTLAIVLFAWFLDFAWCRRRSEADVVDAKYFAAKRRRAGCGAAQPDRPRSSLRRGFETFRDATIWLWQPEVEVPEADGAVDGSALWRRIPARPARLAAAGTHRPVAAVTIGLIVLVSALVGGAQPEIPARGVADRNLFLLTADRGRPGCCCS